MGNPPSDRQASVEVLAEKAQPNEWLAAVLAMLAHDFTGRIKAETLGTLAKPYHGKASPTCTTAVVT